MQLVLQAYIPSLYTSLGIYIPLIVVNCIILGRAESYAYKNPVFPSMFDGLGMGLGFTIALTIIGLVREFLGGCSAFGYELGWFEPIGIFKMAPGAFFVLAILCAIQNKAKIIGAKKGKDVSKSQAGCGHDCLNCNVAGCGDRKEDKFDDIEITQEDIESTAKINVKAIEQALNEGKED